MQPVMDILKALANKGLTMVDETLMDSPKCPVCKGDPYSTKWEKISKSGMVSGKDGDGNDVVINPLEGMAVGELAKLVDKNMVQPAIDSTYTFNRVDTFCSKCGTIWVLRAYISRR